MTQADQIQQASAKLWKAIERYLCAVGDAKWFNGYRCGARAGNDESLYASERRAWQRSERARQTMQTAITNYTSTVRRLKK